MIIYYAVVIVGAWTLTNGIMKLIERIGKV